MSMNTSKKGDLGRLVSMSAIWSGGIKKSGHRIVLRFFCLKGWRAGRGSPSAPNSGRTCAVRFRNAAISGSKSVESCADPPSRREA